jgi:hypothetical protein
LYSFTTTVYKVQIAMLFFSIDETIYSSQYGFLPPFVFPQGGNVVPSPWGKVRMGVLNELRKSNSS